MSGWPKTVDFYIHSDKEYNYYKADEIGLSDEATSIFRYCAYEVKLTLEVHEDGNAFATHVDEIALSQKIKMT